MGRAGYFLFNLGEAGKLIVLKCHFSVGCSPEIGENEGYKSFQILQESRRNSHKNARLTRLGRVHLMQQLHASVLRLQLLRPGLASGARIYGTAAGRNLVSGACMTDPRDLLQVRAERIAGKIGMIIRRAMQVVA
jgi:hypothetical protein